MKQIVYAFLIFSVFNSLPEMAWGHTNEGNLANAQSASTIYQGGYTQAASDNRNKYLGLIGKSGKTVSKINIFIRTFTYSRIAQITTRNGECLHRVYPNPLVGPSFYIGTVAPIESHKVYDIAGRPVSVSATDLGGKYAFTFGRDAQPGIYMIAYKSGGKLYSQKFVLNF